MTQIFLSCNIAETCGVLLIDSKHWRLHSNYSYSQSSKYDFINTPYTCNYCRQQLTVITWWWPILAWIGVKQGSSWRIDCTKRSHLSTTFCSWCIFRGTLSNLLFESIIILNGYTIFLQYRISDFDFVVIVVYCTSNIVAVVCFASCKIILFVTKQKHEVLLLINYISY